MSYQVLARKWRPRSFEDMVGQEHVLQALGNGLAQQRLHHAYLFTGTRGVGKTTIARILAKCLNCERNGVTSTPCNACDACHSIDANRFVDLIEVDAASRTKVEDTRELLDNVQYAPALGRFKIYLIDEVHMLSGHSFNALLKTLEEPPPHVKFLLATTDPQRLPVTVLSRCLQLNLKRLPASLIAAHLEYVLTQEGIAFEAPAVQRIARAADGSLRDGLSVLDQAIAHGGGSVGDASVRGMLGAVDSELVVALLEHVAAGDGPEALACVAGMAEQTPDFAAAVTELLEVLHSMALSQSGAGAGADAVSGADQARIEVLGNRLSAEVVQLFYQIVLTGRRDLPLAAEPRMGFEMLVMRLLAFRPVEPDEGAPAAAIAEPKGQRAAGGASKPQATPAPAPAGAATTPSDQSAAEAPQPASAGAAEGWTGVVANLPLTGMALALAQNSDWVGKDGTQLTLRLDEGHRHLLNAAMQERLESALAQYFEAPLRLRIEVGAVNSETPALSAARSSAERQRAAEDAIAQDPNVAALREAFDARVVPESVKPYGDR